MYYRFDRQLTGKELSAHTLATFMVLQGQARPSDIRSGRDMPSPLLKSLLRAKALTYWKAKGWLNQQGDAFRLSAAGLTKVEERLSGNARGFSVDTDLVLQMADIIRRGAKSRFAKGEDIETIPGNPISVVQATAPSTPATSGPGNPSSTPKAKRALVVSPTRSAKKSVPEGAEGRVNAVTPVKPCAEPIEVVEPPNTSDPRSLFSQFEELGRIRRSSNFFMRGAEIMQIIIPIAVVIIIIGWLSMFGILVGIFYGLFIVLGLGIAVAALKGQINAAIYGLVLLVILAALLL